MTISHSLRHGAVLTALLLSPILGWNGIIVAIGIVLYQFRKGALTVPSMSELKLADKVVAFSFVGYFITCVFSDILHNPASGVWNQLKSLIPLALVALYLLSPNKIRITPQALAAAARSTIVIIFLLTFFEYLYFNILKANPGYRTQLLSGNPLHISLWIPFITTICFADCKDESPRKNLWTVIVSIFSIICITYFLQARASLLALLAVLPVGLYLMMRSMVAPRRGISIRQGKIQAWLMILTAVIASTAAISLAPERVRQLILNPIGYASNPESDLSAENRVAHWKAGIEAIGNRPWVGHGASNEGKILKELVSKYVDAKLFSQSVQAHLHAHQQFISFGIAGGIAAILAACLFMLLPFAYSLLQRRDAVVVLLSTALSFTVILINLTDSLLSNKRHAAIFVMMFAIIISISSATRSDELALEQVDDHN